MNKKLYQNIYHANVNVNFMVENVIQIKSGTLINVKSGTLIKVNVRVNVQKNFICAEKIIFGILLHVPVKMVNIYKLLFVIQ